ncbi:MAG: GSCFA domain-containing protein [Janthinobacterium lividum]
MSASIGVPFNDAYKLTSGNRQRIFTRTVGNGNSGAERLRAGDMPNLRITPKFTLPRSGKFFTIGSCFARNVEAQLLALGVDCLSAKCLIPGAYYDGGGTDRNGALNAYTPQTMRELVNWASRSDRKDVGLLQLGDDEWCDMLLSGLKVLTRAQTDEVREIVLNTYDQLKNADVVVLTLGLTEAWYDLEDNIFVNRSPAGTSRTMKKAERYSFCNASPEETVSVVDQAILDIARVTGGRAKVILTTSPVPLHATFTSRDVISANLYSKSTLFSASLIVADRYDFVDYFPSYELVMYSDPTTTWMEDGAHIFPDRVGKVIKIFADTYFV